MAIMALSPWGAIFRTPLAANSIFSSASFLPQVPDKAGLSPFFSPAVAARLARARTQASTTPHLSVFGTMTFDPPSRKTATAGETAAARAGREPGGGEGRSPRYKLASAR